ncbi:MAG: glycosyltransferase [Ignavibacteriales bacterium]|nr:glycosyltransferase [Ignavibacteriales bacterium]
MKILYFVDGLYRGGKERRLMELLKYIIAFRIMDVEIALMSRDIQYDEIYDLGIKIHFLVRRSKKDLLILRHLFKLCNNIKPDIIHTWDSMTSMYAAPVAQILGIKLINGMITDSSYRNNIFERGWIRSKITFPLSDVIVANSLAGLKAYKAPEKKSVCIYNGFDPKRITNLSDRDIIRKKFNVLTPKVVGMVASFTDRKDYESFITSAQDILIQRDDVTFLAVGDGVLLKKCKSMVDARFRENIKFLGLQSDGEPIINIFDVGILTTNVEVHEEGISNSILEYMALGKPVIATDSGGTKEIIVDGKTGFIIPPKDPNILTNRIMEILSRPDRGLEMGRKGKQRVVDLFSLDTMVAKYIELYRKCINEKGN